MAKRSHQPLLFPPEPGASGSAPVPAENSAAGPPLLPSATVKPVPESLEGRSVYAVDANSLIHQVFHALPEMTSPSGEPVGAVFGFARDIFYLLETKKPDYLFCAFDLPDKTFRHALYEPYKGNRPAVDVDLAPQFTLIRELLDALGVPSLACPGYEADDLLATIGWATEQRGGECYLVTGDKDCRQLITDRVKVYNIRKDQVLDRQVLRAEWGISPEQVVDYQALVGDSTDNVPGVPLIGPKLAQQLLESYGTLEGVFAHVEEVAGTKRKQNLIAGREQALLSRQLVRLDRHVPCAIPWAGARPGRFDLARIKQLAQRFGFRSLQAKVETLAGTTAVPLVQPQPSCTYHTVDTTEALDALVQQLRGQSRISIDLETTHVWPRWAEIVGISVAWGENEAWYLPVCGPPGERCLARQPTLEKLRDVLENPAIEKVGQNLKYDWIVLRGAGIELAGVAFDTMVASYLIEAGERNHNLNDLAQRYLGRGKTDIRDLIGSGKSQKRMDEVSIERVTTYAGDDAVLPLRLRPLLAKKLVEDGLERLFIDLEMPLIEVLVELEHNGVRIDLERLAELSGRFGERIAALEREIHELAGHAFNIASPKQLQQVLFAEQGLPVLARTKTGPSTDADVLEELAMAHALPAKILEYRQYTKLKSTYVDALPRMVHAQDRARPRVVPPGGDGHWPIEFQRS